MPHVRRSLCPQGVPMYPRLWICLLLLALATPAYAGEEWLNWSYPYNESMTRVYTAHLATIVAITETGDGELNEFDNPAGAHQVVMTGRGHDGTIAIVPEHPTCWRVEMR